jgi:hypothetical protein
LKKLKDTVKNLRIRILLKGKMMFDETKLPQPSPEKMGMTSLLNSGNISLILKRQLWKTLK